MAQRTLRRILAGGALLAALTLTTPPPAHAAGLSTESLWSWLSTLWTGPARTTVSGHAPARKPSPTTGFLEKIGVCIDPNGGTGTQTGGASPCGASSSDVRPSTDPNG
jgi:hypothetical protein